MARLINSAGLDLIKKFEGLRLEPYRDVGGLWTIGWGHLCSSEHEPISTEQAEQLLETDLMEAENEVCKLVKVALTDNQFAALVSFAFNLGPGRLAGSTLLKKLNDGDYDAVPDQIKLWDHAGGKVCTGIARRRAAEAELFTKGS